MLTIVLLSTLGVNARQGSASPQINGALLTRAALSPATSRIQNVVIIYQENHTFDNLLGETCSLRASRCDGYAGPVTFADGKTAPNITEPDVVPRVAHGILHQSEALANRWDLITGCRRPPYICVSHADPAGIPNVTALALHFTVSDATFAAYPTASYGAHVQLTAGTLDGFTSGYNPVNSKTGAPPGPGWGCPSRKDVRWRDGRWVPSCVPNPRGEGSYRETPVRYRATVMERIEEAGLTWHVYQGDLATEPTNDQWSICTYFTWCYRHRFDLDHDSNTASFIKAAQSSDALPNVSFMMPQMPESQHNGTSLAIGDNYIGRIVNAIETGPHWNSTAIFLTWDDCGCFYDHVTPPEGMSFRDPMIIVSPWVKPGYTDSTTANQPYSILAFIQHNFGLANLSRSVNSVYDYGDSFDFSQVPLPGIPMTQTSIPTRERAKLKRLAPLIEDDTT